MRPAASRAWATTDHMMGIVLGLPLARARLQRGVAGTGIPHPLHLHMSNLGLAGNVATPAAPRKLYGLKDRGELPTGAVADISVYKMQADKAALFRNAAYFFKDGQLVVRDGKALSYPRGKTLCVNPDYDPEVDRRLDAHYQRSSGLARDLFCVPEEALPEGTMMQTPS